MRKGIVQLITIGFVTGAMVLSGPSPALTQEQGTADLIAPNMPREGIPTNQIIIKYKDTAQINAANAPDAPARLQMLSAVAGVELAYNRPMSGDAHVLRLPQRMPVKDVQAISSRLSALADVEYAEPDHIMQPVLTPNDPQYSNQWHYYGTYGINLPLAWDITTGSASVVVAVIDTGHRPHIDLSGRFIGGYDFISDVQVANDGNGRDNDPEDPGDWITAAESTSGHFAGCQVRNSSWHGTHVAGTIGANSDNSVGVAGVNWHAKLLSVRVLGKCGGLMSDVIDGMRWAAGLTVAGVPANTHPAKVLNLSLGGPGMCSTSLQNAINAINATGSIIVVAAGNQNTNASGYIPASCAGVITVGATNSSGVRASFSNYGAPVDVSAPGTSVLSTANTGTQGPAADNYMYYQGTSMAAPHVAGVASLMATINPTLNYTQTEDILKATVRSFGPGNNCAILGCGTGIVNARAALDAAAAGLKRAYIPIAQKGAPPASSAIANPGFESGSRGGPSLRRKAGH